MSNRSCSSAVLAWAAGGSSGAIALLSSSGSRAGAAVDEDRVDLAGLLEQPLRRSRA